MPLRALLLCSLARVGPAHGLPALVLKFRTFQPEELEAEEARNYDEAEEARNYERTLHSRCASEALRMEGTDATR